MTTKQVFFCLIFRCSLALALASGVASAQELPDAELTPEEARAIAKEAYIYANPVVDGYLLNSPMLDDFVRDADGGITFYLQLESPGKDKEPNWLPAPKGPFSATLRLYWPKEEALNGTWQLPPLQRVK